LTAKSGKLCTLQLAKEQTVLSGYGRENALVFVEKTVDDLLSKWKKHGKSATGIVEKPIENQSLACRKR
jgi:hypothetical protein